MSLNLALSRTKFIGLSAIALSLMVTAAIAAPTAPQSTNGTDAPANQYSPPHGHRHPGRGMGPFARFDADGDGKIFLKDVPEKSRAHLATIDTNKDGAVTREEFDQGREQLRILHEKEMDGNHDGTVTKEERRAFMQSRFNEHFASDDKNKDGSLTEDELPKARFEHLRVADKNKDSKLTKAEIEEAFASGALGPRGHRWEGQGPNNEADRQARMQQRFNAKDKNRDGYLVQSEVPNRWDHMKVADSNGDNRLSFAEVKAAKESGKLGPPRGHTDRGRHEHGCRNQK